LQQREDEQSSPPFPSLALKRGLSCRTAEILIGVYRDKHLHYAARVRAGFVPLTRRQVFEWIKSLETAKCPFVNLPEKEAGRWGQALTAEKMKVCVWVKPRIMAEIEFVEWTGADHLRHAKFVGLRDDKDPRLVVSET
jgi:ATP-dependent DNA ligase